MVRAMIRRLILSTALLAAIGGSLIAGTATPAASAPAANAVTVSGEGLAEPVTVRADTDPELFAALLDQVSWLRGSGHASPPKDLALGPKYTVVVLNGDVASQIYDLYPLAAGGPRAFRPAKQPDQRKTTAAWFFGRLSMSEALRAAGAPLPESTDILTSSVGSGDRVFPDSMAPAEGIEQVLHDLRRLILLNGAVVLVIAAGLAGVSLLLRRRTR